MPADARRLARAARSLRGAEVVTGPPAFRRALVIAPHPDDETLGCGGTMALLADGGAAVTVLTVTDGEATRGSRLGPEETGQGAARRGRAGRGGGWRNGGFSRPARRRALEADRGAVGEDRRRDPGDRARGGVRPVAAGRDGRSPRGLRGPAQSAGRRRRRGRARGLGLRGLDRAGAEPDRRHQRGDRAQARGAGGARDRGAGARPDRRRGARTLAIDADARRPRLRRGFPGHLRGRLPGAGGGARGAGGRRPEAGS